MKLIYLFLLLLFFFSSCAVTGEKNAIDHIYINFTSAGLNLTEIGLTLYTSTEGNTHVLQADGTQIDRLRRNIILNPVEILYFSNTSGIYLNLSSVDGTTIKINLEGKQIALDSNEYIIQLNNGSQKTPKLNLIYFYNQSNPTIAISNNEEFVESIEHIWITRALVGNYTNSTYNIYATSEGDDLVQSFLYKLEERIYHQGLIYESGFFPNVTTTEINIGLGDYFTKLNLKETLNYLNLSSSAYLINSTGDYVLINSLSDITQYSDTGNLIGNSKYYNIVWGIVSSNGVVRLIALIQKEPTTEYNSIGTSLTDEDNVLVSIPNIEIIRHNYLPIARTIIQKGTDNFEIVSGTDRFLDLRGTSAGSGGGSAPSPSITNHADLTNLDFISSGHTGFIGGSLTNNYLGIGFNGSLINSIIYESNNYIGINTTTPASLLEVKGTGWFRTAGGDEQINLKLGELEGFSSTPLFEFITDDVSNDLLEIRSNRQQNQFKYTQKDGAGGYKNVWSTLGNFASGSILQIFDVSEDQAISLNAGSKSWFAYDTNGLLVGSTYTNNNIHGLVNVIDSASEGKGYTLIRSNNRVIGFLRPVPDSVADTELFIGYDDNGDGIPSKNPIRLSTKAGDDSYIDNTGNFGLGTSGPNHTLHVIGDVSISDYLVLGSNTINGLSSGDINASTIYYDTLQAKSPIFECSNNWCSISFPQYQKILYLEKNNNWTINKIIYENQEYTILEFWNLVKDTPFRNIALRLNDKLQKLQDKYTCESTGKLWANSCYTEEIIKIPTTYNDSIILTPIYEKNQINSSCTQLDSKLIPQTIPCYDTIETTQIIDYAYSFKTNYHWNETLGYYYNEKIRIDIE